MQYNLPILEQAYNQYTAEAHQVWNILFERQMKQLPALASQAFLDGLPAIRFTAERIPNFQETNELLSKLTGWKLFVVKGLIPNKEFFELMADCNFPATTWLRRMDQLDYLEEPDMFHDVFGHVPLLTNADFCNFLQALSKLALVHIENEWAIELISRIYWYTVEFGLINTEEGLRIYGAGILSSSGESVYCMGDVPTRVPYNVQDVVNTPYIKDRYQEKYFVINSYRELYESIGEIERVINQEVANLAAQS